ncbi:MAG: ABC transporter permease [Eubacteriales bacterium]|nr:ABC transporter permease [Clostridiales bacterium]MDY5836067.1 ABC transporter permease [Eubacteriales bacterium]
MSFLRLIAAEWRLVMAPSSRQFVLLLLIFALVLPLSALFLNQDTQASLLQADMSLVTEESHPLLDYTVEELQNHPLVGKVYVDDPATAEEHLREGEVVILVKFPPNFFATVGNIAKREQVQIVLSPYLKVESEIMARFFDAVSKTITRNSASYYAYYNLAEPFFLSPTLLSAHFTQRTMQMVSRIFEGTEEDTHTDHPRFNMEAHIIASFFVILATFAAFLPLIFTIRDEDNGLCARFLSLGISRAELLLAHLICGLPFLILSSIPVAAVAGRVFVFSLPPELFLVILLLYLGTGALLLTLHSLWPRLGKGSLYVGYWLIFALLLLGGVIYPNDLLPRGVRIVAQAVLTAPAHSSLFMHFAQDSAGHALGQLTALTGLSLACLAGAEARKSQRNLL